MDFPVHLYRYDIRGQARSSSAGLHYDGQVGKSVDMQPLVMALE